MSDTIPPPPSSVEGQAITLPPPAAYRDETPLGYDVSNERLDRIERAIAELVGPRFSDRSYGWLYQRDMPDCANIYRKVFP